MQTTNQILQKGGVKAAMLSAIYFSLVRRRVEYIVTAYCLQLDMGVIAQPTLH